MCVCVCVSSSLSNRQLLVCVYMYVNTSARLHLQKAVILLLIMHDATSSISSVAPKKKAPHKENHPHDAFTILRLRLQRLMRDINVKSLQL